MTTNAMMPELRWVLRRLQYPQEVMLVCVRWYAAYPLSLRHLEEAMQELASLLIIQPCIAVP